MEIIIVVLSAMILLSLLLKRMKERQKHDA
jgi:hypothetical protein